MTNAKIKSHRKVEKNICLWHCAQTTLCFSFQVMQFGRIDGNAYTLDFQYPFSAIQAFAVALANVTQRLKWICQSLHLNASSWAKLQMPRLVSILHSILLTCNSHKFSSWSGDIDNRFRFQPHYRSATSVSEHSELRISTIRRNSWTCHFVRSPKCALQSLVSLSSSIVVVLPDKCARSFKWEIDHCKKQTGFQPSKHQRKLLPFTWALQKRGVFLGDVPNLSHNFVIHEMSTNLSCPCLQVQLVCCVLQVFLFSILRSHKISVHRNYFISRPQKSVHVCDFTACWSHFETAVDPKLSSMFFLHCWMVFLFCFVGTCYKCAQFVLFSKFFPGLGVCLRWTQASKKTVCFGSWTRIFFREAMLWN